MLDVPFLTTAQMIEVDRAMMEDYRIELIQMMENAGRNLAHLALASTSGRSLPRTTSFGFARQPRHSSIGASLMPAPPIECLDLHQSKISIPMLSLPRHLCSDENRAGQHEWLVANGIGGFASGTVSGTLTRRYHGLLVAALKPPLGRTLLVAKEDTTARYDNRTYALSANKWEGGPIDPRGFIHLNSFHLDGSTPVWTFACADALLEKRVWMTPGANTTYLQYRLIRGTQPLTLWIKTLVDYRDFHGTTRTTHNGMDITPVDAGLQVIAYSGATPFYLLSATAEAQPKHDWYRGYALDIEAYRGLDATEDHYHAGTFTATLQPGKQVTLVCSTAANPSLDGPRAYQTRQIYEAGLLKQAALEDEPETIQHLVLAADQFVVRRTAPTVDDGRSILAGYPWFGDWGRDTMIALPGLALSTGRPNVAARILRTFAHFVDQGMLPNRFPDAGERPEYNTVDATLWYFEAIRAYHEATEDDALLQDLYPVLQDIIDWHHKGTRYHIHVDPQDHLLYAGETGIQLTWMDAKVGDWVVTPRIGKPVEVNALWYHTLCCMAAFAQRLNTGDAKRYAKDARAVKKGFGRFWSEALDYCYDVLDGPDGHEARLRPNQLIAVSLRHSPLSKAQQKAVVDACARHLLTPHGLRSLSPDDPDYVPTYGGDARQRDGAYHQGTVWGWLIGPFVEAHLRVYKDPATARSFLRPLLNHLGDHAVGNLSEIFDGDPPFTPRGTYAQAWTVAEVLRTWMLTQIITKG